MTTLDENPVVKEAGTLTDLEDLIRPPAINWRTIVRCVLLVLWAVYIVYQLFGETKVGIVMIASSLPIGLYLTHRARERQRWFLAVVAMRAMSLEIKELRAAKV